MRDSHTHSKSQFHSTHNAHKVVYCNMNDDFVSLHILLAIIAKILHAQLACVSTATVIAFMFSPFSVAFDRK